MRSHVTLSVLLAIVLSTSLLPAMPAAAAPPPFADDAIEAVWRRTDEPVSSQAVRRTWLWGPAPFASLYEPYEEAPGGQRLVQYYDKSRMEITDTNGDRISPWFVTNGLLARELITGQVQLGDATFAPRGPAEVPVAGDPDDALGPTYATFNGLLAGVGQRTGGVVETLDRAGRVGTNDALAGATTYAYFARETGHNIPSVFWDFLQTVDLVQVGAEQRTEPLFDPIFFATGLPISEAYWATATVGGQPTQVLIQAYERRVLTYTPSNPAGFRVEMGNVGQHYYRWRHGSAERGLDQGQVVQVYAGDTYDIRLGSEVKPVRLSGVSAPWATRAAGPADCYGHEASAAARGLLAGKTVLLERDGADTDDAGRLRRALYVDGLFVNDWLVRAGYAQVSPAPQETTYQATLREVQYDAQARRAGLWGACPGALPPPPPAAAPGAPPPATPWHVLAGHQREPGQFYRPMGVAVDEQGQVYVADTWNHRLQKLAAGGQSLAQWGSEGGEPGQFLGPASIAVNRQGQIYVADPGNRRLQKLAPDGRVLAHWWSDENHPGEPGAVALDRQGQIYVVEAGHSRVRKLTPDGQPLAEWVIKGVPSGVAVDEQGQVYIADTLNHRIHKLGPDGRLRAEWDAGVGTVDYGGPVGLAVDGQGQVYVADPGNHRLQKFAPDGKLVAQWGGKGSAPGHFRRPSGLAVDGQGQLYVADTDNHRIQQLSPDGQPLAQWGSVGDVHNRFGSLRGIAVDSQRNVYLTDTWNNRVHKLSVTGQRLAQWGDFGSAPGQFTNPHGVAVDGQGQVYVVDTTNHRLQKFSRTGQRLAQWGTEGSGPGEFRFPGGVAVDRQGQVYVADTWNHRIQKFSADGQPLAQWGTQGNAPGQFFFPAGVAVDDQGQVYVADKSNSRVQKLSPTGQPLAQWGTSGSAPGQFSGPEGVAVDRQGQLYVADTGNDRIQKLSPDGQPLAQWGSHGIAPGQFFQPTGVAVDEQGQVYVADSLNYRIQTMVP